MFVGLRVAKLVTLLLSFIVTSMYNKCDKWYDLLIKINSQFGTTVWGVTVNLVFWLRLPCPIIISLDCSRCCPSWLSRCCFSWSELWLCCCLSWSTLCHLPVHLPLGFCRLCQTSGSQHVCLLLIWSLPVASSSFCSSTNGGHRTSGLGIPFLGCSTQKNGGFIKEQFWHRTVWTWVCAFCYTHRILLMAFT